LRIISAMRASGALEAPPDDVGAHVCWCFDDDAGFRDAAVGYLADGLARRERVAYVADRSIDALRHDVSSLGDVDRLLGDGDLVLQPLRALYEPGGAFDVAAQVDSYRRLTDAAVRDGHTGLRVAADVTALVGTDADRHRFMAYELAVDRLMSTEPMSALCAYHRRTLGPAVAGLAAVHPLHHGSAPPVFRAYFDAGRLCLAGEADLAGHDAFALVAATAAATDDVEVVIDARGLEFIDARCLAILRTLDTTLRRAGRRLRVDGATPLVLVAGELVGLDAVTGGRPA
jgi:anti-anti-sigma regulatory factor